MSQSAEVEEKLALYERIAQLEAALREARWYVEEDETPTDRSAAPLLDRIDALLSPVQPQEKG
jgi:hypothetical protein